MHRLKIFWAGAALLMLAPSGPLRAERAEFRCQILDHIYEPVYRVRMGYIPRSRFEVQGERQGSSSVIDLEADWEMGYRRDVLGGDVDLHLRIRNDMFMGEGALDRPLPTQVSALFLDAGWTRRLDGQRALQIRLKPGLSGDLAHWGAQTLYLPVSVTMIHSFHPAVSAETGLELRPGFRRELMPLIGLKWEAARWLLVEPRLPSSRVQWFPTPHWTLYGGFHWRNYSYALNDERGGMTLEDYRVKGGVRHRLSDQLEVSAEFGRIFGRVVRFRRRAADAVVDDALFVRVGMGGMF